MSDQYEITITTGTKSGAGTDATVSVTLLGTNGTTGPHKLDKRWKDDFEEGKTDTYKFKGPDVGELIGLRFQMDAGTFGVNGDWYNTRSQVRRGDSVWDFPNYTWLRSGHTRNVQEESAELPQKCTLTGQFDLRRMEIMNRRETFTWRDNPGWAVPGALDISETRPLPVDEKYRDLKEASYEVIFAKTMVDMKLTSNLFKNVWDKIDDVRELFAKFEIPHVANRWQSDIEFARQCVQGVSPVHIQSITEIPKGMAATEDLVYGLLEAGQTLAEALAAKRIFLTDFEELVGIPLFDKTDDDGNRELRYAYPARALFYLHSDGHLRPLCIEFDREEDGLVFTPKDGEYDWLAAKMHLRCAEGNVHQVLPHALRTHFVIEPFVMAILRNLASSHPIFKMMRRHIRYTLAINEGARASLLAVGKVFDNFIACGGPDQGHVKLMVKGYSYWKLEHNHPRKELASRGVLDPEILPYYPYRDDGLPIWDAIHDYVDRTLRFFYASDEDVVNDNELQDFWEDLITKGHPVEKLNCSEMTRVEDLVEMLAIVIWTGSAQHAAVNYQQFEHYGFVPNAPLCMRGEAPTEKGVLDEKGLVQMMPSKSQSTWQVAIGRALASFGKDEEYLHQEGGFHEGFFEEPEVKAIVEGFERTMAQIDADTKARNAKREVPYNQLVPSQVPTSITI